MHRSRGLESIGQTVRTHDHARAHDPIGHIRFQTRTVCCDRIPPAGIRHDECHSSGVKLAPHTRTHVAEHDGFIVGIMEDVQKADEFAGERIQFRSDRTRGRGWYKYCQALEG